MGDTNDPPVEQSVEIKRGWRPEGWVNEYRQYTGIIADLETNDGNIGKCNPAECQGDVFEEGADAMLEELLEAGLYIGGAALVQIDHKGVTVFTQEED